MSDSELNSGIFFHLKNHKRTLKYWYLLLAVHLAGAIFLLAFLSHDFSSLLLFILFSCVAIFNLAYAYQIWQMTRLVIPPWGIEYYRAKFQLTSSWEELSLTRKRTILAPFWPIRLMMKNPRVKRNYWFDWDFDLFWGNARYYIPFVPGVWERYDEIVRLIKQHRPNLLVE